MCCGVLSPDLNPTEHMKNSGSTVHEFIDLFMEDLRLKCIEPHGVICPLHLTHPSYLAAVGSHSRAPGDQLLFWGKCLGQGQRQEYT